MLTFVGLFFCRIMTFHFGNDASNLLILKMLFVSSQMENVELVCMRGNIMCTLVDLSRMSGLPY